MQIRLACGEAGKTRVAVHYLLALTTAYWLLLIAGLLRSDLALLPGTRLWALPDAQHTAFQRDEAYWAWPSGTADFAGRGGEARLKTCTGDFTACIDYCAPFSGR